MPETLHTGKKNPPGRTTAGWVLRLPDTDQEQPPPFEALEPQLPQPL